MPAEKTGHGGIPLAHTHTHIFSTHSAAYTRTEKVQEYNPVRLHKYNEDNSIKSC